MTETRIETRLLRLNPQLPDTEITRWADGGRTYADRLDRLPAVEREAVAFLFACFGLAVEQSDKKRIMGGIDMVCAPYYKGARHAAATAS